MECSKIYFDTNIVLDLLDENRPFRDHSMKLWNLVALYEIDIFISEDILSTVYYIHKNKQQVLEFFKSIQPIWNIVPFGKDVITQAIEISLEQNIDFEDTLQCLCAKENGCDFLISNDGKFYDCGVDIITSEEFLQKFGEKLEH